MSHSKKVKKSFIIKNDDLRDPAKISKVFDYLNVNYKPINKINIVNTNIELGLESTKVKKEDILVMKKFISRIPSKYLNDLKYMIDSLQKHEKSFEEEKNI